MGSSITAILGKLGAAEGMGVTQLTQTMGPAGKTMGGDAITQGPPSSDPTSIMDILERMNDPNNKSPKAQHRNDYATMYANAPKPDVMTQGQIRSLLNAYPAAPAYNKLPTRKTNSLLGY